MGLAAEEKALREQEMMEQRQSQHRALITQNEADFLEMELNSDSQMNSEIEIVAEDDERRTKADAAVAAERDSRPLLIQRVLSDDDLSRLKELRVSNLMALWNRRREEVGLEEERNENEMEIDTAMVQSLTVLRREKKEQRKAAMARTNSTKNQKTWDQYRKE